MTASTATAATAATTPEPSAIIDPPPAPIDPPAMKPRLSGAVRGFLLVSPFLLTAAVGFGGAGALGWLSSTPAAPYGKKEENRYLALYASNPPTTAHAGADPNGAALYAHHCAHCHGVNGDGNGPTPLSPKARHFGYERFKFTDTLNGLKQPQGAAGTLGGVPTDEVLVALVRRGIAGSPMPAFETRMTDEEIRAVVGYVRTRFVRPQALFAARMDLELAKAKKEDDFDPNKDWPPKQEKRDRWYSEAVADITGSEPVAVPTPFPEPRAGYEQRAAVLFTKLGCVGCHGRDCCGTIDPNRRNDNGTLAYPRDLTAGVYKGGEEEEHLYRRIYLGIPGTPMKSFSKEASPDDITDLVYYVKRKAFVTNPPPATLPAR